MSLEEMITLTETIVEKEKRIKELEEEVQELKATVALGNVISEHEADENWEEKRKEILNKELP